MTQEIINVGSAPDDGQGDPLRTAFTKTNNNFSQLFSSSANGYSDIHNGNSNVNIATANGNITMSASGTANVIVVSNTIVSITGDLAVSGNASLTGNIVGDRITNGTTSIEIPVANGNANITVGGTSNVVVFSTAGEYVSGLISATGNVTANNGMFTTIVNVASHTGTLVSITGNVTANNGMFTNVVNVASFTGTLLSVSGNVDGGNLNTGGLISTTGNVTAAGITLGSGALSTTGNISAGYYLGNGSQLTGILASGGASIDNGTSNVKVVGPNVTVNIGGTSNIVVYATTGEYVTGLVSVTGNVIGNNGMFTTIVNVASHTGAVVSVSGNITGGNISAVANVNSANIVATTLSATGNVVVVGVQASGNISATANIQGGNISTAGNVNGANLVATTLSATGNVVANNVMTTTIADAASLTGGLVSVTGNITAANLILNGTAAAGSGVLIVSGDIQTSAANATANIGNASNYFNRLFAQATTALYADLAEMYTTDADYAPGTVLVFGGNQEVTMSTVAHDTRVAGVVSTNPAHIMNSGLQGTHTVAVALTGRVPVSVVGNISAGDQVVTSNRAGVAEALDMSRYQPGVIIGKALQSYSSDDVGVIEVVVGRL